MRVLTKWVAAAATAAAILWSIEVVAAEPTEAGLLTCEVSGGVALIVSSPRELHCVFQKSNGQSEAYGGRIQEFGIDLGFTGAGVIAWAVTAESTDLPPGELAGRYGGAEAGATVVVGGEARALFGGSGRTVSLQPLSVEGDAGLNIAVGVASLELYPLFKVGAQPLEVSTPAVGHAYSEVPHARQTPHYGCGSYTHLMHGQTLYGLAHACSVTLEALLDANPQITNVRDVPAGALIHLPGHVGHHAASPCGDRAVLQEQETLDHLAWRCSVTLHALLQANPSVRDMALVRAGLVLSVPDRRAAPTRPPVRYARNEMSARSGASDSSSSSPAASSTRSAQNSDMKTERVRFGGGQTKTSIKGTITGRESVSYVLGAEAGQTMTIALKPSNRQTYFNVYEPGKGPGDQALATGSMTGPMVPDLNRFSGKLPTSGEYTISVYMMRAAARRNERSSYTLDISISALGDAAQRPPVQRDYADGLQGGPDYWGVETGGASRKLDIHTSASSSARVIGSVPSGAVLRNLGCRMAEGRRWCRVETVSAPHLSGWTPGEFLRESSYTDSGTQTAAATGASSDFRTETVHFKSGTSGANLHSKIVGREIVDYKLAARAGQAMRVQLKTDNAANYFNIMEPGQNDAAFFIGSTRGNTFDGQLKKDGTYTIRVYLMRSAARRNETANYTLSVNIPPAQGARAPTHATTSHDAKVAGTNFHATGNIPCARNAGQPMGSCKFGVVRKGQGNGTVTVFWPDGGNRVIFFENGTPAAFDQSQADGNVRMTTRRNGDLFTVTIGPQRFEIPEAVISGG